MSEDLVLTIDGGGSSIKAAVYSLSRAAPAAVAVEEVSASYPREGFAEFDTESWWRSVLAAMRRAVTESGEAPSAYIGITCTGMRIPFVLVDRNGEALAPAVMNLDRRGSAYLQRVRDALGADRLYELTGHWPNAKFGLPKLLWYVEHAPELWRRTERVLQFHDWLIFRLCGAQLSEPSSAAMGQLVDVRRRNWAHELLAALGLDAELFPPLADAGIRAGGLLADVASAVGLAAGTPVHVGGGDTHVSSLGSGAAHPGTLSIVGGSTTPLMLTTSAPGRFDAAAGPLVSPHLDPSLWALETNAGATGIHYSWLRGVTVGTSGDGYAALDERAARSPLGANGLIVAGACPVWGEKAWERSPPTTMIGLTPGHTVGDLARATLESIAYAVKGNLEALESATGAPPETIVFTGGASRSSFTCQLLADVLGREIRVPDVREPAAAGGAALVTGDPAVTAADERRFVPDASCHDAYGEFGERYRTCYATLREGFGQ